MPALRVCPTPGCPNLVYRGRCPTCARNADLARGTAPQRGYTGQHRSRFRAGILTRNPACVCMDCTDHVSPCGEPSTVADHYPRTRRELVACGMDPDDPANGRGLCARCHNRHTARTSPGGWHTR